MSRPRKITKSVINKLEEAFSLGCTDKEACVLADIGKQTLYDYQKVNTSFKERKEILKSIPILKARRSVVERLENDPNLAFKYLERRCREEFGSNYKQDVSISNRQSSDELTKEEAERFEELLSNIFE